MPMTQALQGLSGPLVWLGDLLRGPFGGLVGGTVSFFVLEVWYRRRRRRHQLAEALAAELTNINDRLKSFIDDEDSEEVPAYYRTSEVLFKALADQLAALDFGDIVSVTKVFQNLDELNRMPAAWRERALNALQLPHGHPDKESEFKATKEGRAGFYILLKKVRQDCIGLAEHLRTKYAVGWRSWFPRRLKPTKQIPKTDGE